MSTFTVKKSYRESCIKIAGTFKAGGYREPSISTQIDCYISTTEARDLATALIAEADRADEKAKKKADEAARRKAWRDREKAAGRMVEISWADAMRGR